MEMYRFLFSVLVLAIIPIKSIGKSHSVCEKGATDCSSLIPNAPSNSCYMHQNDEYKTFNFTTWTKVQVTHLTSVVDAGFDVAVSCHKLDLLPAYNVTIEKYSPDINGFVMILAEQAPELDQPWNSSRIFDFRDSGDQLKKPFQLYYDCYQKLDLNGIYQYLLTIRALPNNKQLVFQMNVPNMESSEITCKSETLIMVSVYALLENQVSIKFQKLPNRWDVSEYDVTLIRKDSKTFYRRKILESSTAANRSMISMTFNDIDKGIYNLSVQPLLRGGKECSITRIPNILIPKALPNYAFIGWIVGAVLFIGLINVAAYYALQKKLKSILKPCGRKLLIIHYHDSDEHATVIRSLAEYLQRFFSFKIFVDFYINQDISNWIVDSIKSADAIMFVLSNGIKNIASQNKQNAGKVPPPRGYLFRPLYDHVCDELIRGNNWSKTVVKVHFQCNRCDFVPDKLSLRRFGSEYELMKDFKKVLCRIKGVSTLWSWFLCIPEKGRENLNAAIKKALESQCQEESTSFLSSSELTSVELYPDGSTGKDLPLEIT